jgi:hypothetical protein
VSADPSTSVQPVVLKSWTATWRAPLLVMLSVAVIMWCQIHVPVETGRVTTEDVAPASLYDWLRRLCIGLLFVPGVLFGFTRIRLWLFLGCLVAYGAGLDLAWCVAKWELFTRLMAKPDLWPYQAMNLVAFFCLGVGIGAIGIASGKLAGWAFVAIKRPRSQ